MTEKIPPMPSRWTGTVDEWIAYRKAGNDAAQAYWNQLAQTPAILETDEYGNPVIPITINPKSGMAEDARPSLVKRLFSR